MWRFAEIRRVPDIARYWASQRPEKVALIEGAATRTYADLDRRSSRIANRLLAAGTGPGAHIGFLGRNSMAFFEVWFAAGKAGCAFAPFNWRCPIQELIGLLDDAMPPLVFVGAEFVDVMREVQARCRIRFELVTIDPAGSPDDRLTSWIADAANSDPRVALAGTEIALLSYTSGTTGQPKGVQAAHDAFNYSFLCASLEPAMAWGDDDIMLMSMPNFHLAGSWVSLAALYHGATLSILPAFEPGAFFEVLRRDRPTITPLVPAAIQSLLDRPDLKADDFSSLRSVMYFGSPIAPDMLRRATQALGCEFHQFYGTTETWFLSILRHEHHVSGHPNRLASCGVPLPLVGIKVVDGKGDEVPFGTVGELLARTPMVFSGYLRRPEATAEVLREGWYHTGDLGRQDEDGFFYLVDRAKDMIVTGAENVYSAEVESALMKHPAVAQVAVIGTPDTRWGEKVTALVVLAAGAAASEADLQEHCRLYLARYKTPKSIIFETSLPMTASGKVQKSALRNRFRAG
jgi:acyl-CoA synthetase (AMP-forming)/AMP-acid ligase II